MREEAMTISRITDKPLGVSNTLLEMAAADWLKVKQNEVKESTLAQYRRIIRVNLMPAFNGIDWSTITQNELNIFGEKMLKKYQPRTARTIIVTANQILEYAYGNGFISNPHRMDIKIKTCKASRPQVFTTIEQKILTEYLFSEFDLQRLGILVCMYTGLRLGEICGLKWADIDLNRGVLKVSRTIQRISNGSGGSYFSIGNPKSESSEREIPIPHFLNEILSKQISAAECYVITGTEQFMQPRTYQNILKRYFSDCDMPGYHFHTLRHTFASRAIEIGFDPKSLSEILGHSNVRITLDLYVHPSMEAKKREMERFSSFVEFT